MLPFLLFAAVEKPCRLHQHFDTETRCSRNAMLGFPLFALHGSYGTLCLTLYNRPPCTQSHGHTSPHVANKPSFNHKPAPQPRANDSTPSTIPTPSRAATPLPAPTLHNWAPHPAPTHG